MTEQQEFIDHLEGLARRSPPAAGAAPWLAALRAQGIARFREAGIPSVKEEDWKFTSLHALTQHRYAPAQEQPAPGRGALAGYLDPDEIVLVFINGLFAKEFSRDQEGIPGGLTVRALSDLSATNGTMARALFAPSFDEARSSLARLNDALMRDAACVHLDDNIILKKPVHIVHLSVGQKEDLITAPRTAIRLGCGAQASVLESHIAFTDTDVYFANALTDIAVGENASLHYCKAQKESLQAFHIGGTRVQQGANSNFYGFSLAAGAALTRNDLEVVLSGEGATAILNGLYSVYRDQHVDNHTSVDHRVAHATSNQLYKGILNDSARAVFNGKILVRTIAQGTNSYQLNKNLLLGRDCRVDTKPQLEIFADDVKCSHGATIGQLDPEEIFYLQSRCIGAKAAARLLTRGFADDIINTVREEGIRKKLARLLEPTLGALA